MHRPRWHDDLRFGQLYLARQEVQGDHHAREQLQGQSAFAGCPRMHCLLSVACQVHNVSYSECLNSNPYDAHACSGSCGNCWTTIRMSTSPCLVRLPALMWCTTGNDVLWTRRSAAFCSSTDSTLALATVTSHRAGSSIRCSPPNTHRSPHLHCRPNFDSPQSRDFRALPWETSWYASFLLYYLYCITSVSRVSFRRRPWSP